MTVHFFYGEEEFDIEMTLNAMRSELDSNFSAMNYRSGTISSAPAIQIYYLRQKQLSLSEKKTIKAPSSYFIPFCDFLR